ncbi:MULTISPECIES: daptide-type RiPP biosynthesis methyltransferase [unclassified Streptomyces]|uniref:daptide-type RiPP biosynthesis methyltransferase n=1 Tax=unclassified Streptomyces TaxID=2593676 RepID=UPI0024433E96|nr:daptide-type RiPP biosynthesis methyltransferase [Streptomyces sp. DH41]MDG9726537.1 class I SAM-dependent methyltransferase [Streptomyces sp. DH41]
MTALAPTTTLVRPPGLGGERIARLGDRARLCGLYDQQGAPLYDDLAAADGFEIRDIVGAVRAAGDGPVLDLAAGAGRFTLPLLATGREVTALDLSDHMLELLRSRLARAPKALRERCTVVQGDMAAFDLRREYAHIVLGTTSLSLLDEAGRAGLYRSVAAHLAPGGQFLLSVMERADDEAPTEVHAQVKGAGGTMYDLYEYWPAGAAFRYVTIAPSAPAEGPVTVCVDEVGTMSIAAIEAELAEAGLVIAGRRPLSGPGDRHRVSLLKAVAAR